MTENELKIILDLHKKWLNNESPVYGVILERPNTASNIESRHATVEDAYARAYEIERNGYQFGIVVRKLDAVKHGDVGGWYEIAWTDPKEMRRW